MKKANSPRFDAATKGEKTYSTGKPCSNGHDSHRYTSTGVCVECNKGYQNDHRLMIRNLLKSN